MTTGYSKSVDAAQAAIDAHECALKLEANPDKSVALWHLLVSLLDWCNEHDLDLKQQLAEATEEWAAYHAEA